MKWKRSIVLKMHRPGHSLHSGVTHATRSGRNGTERDATYAMTIEIEMRKGDLPRLVSQTCAKGKRISNGNLLRMGCAGPGRATIDPGWDRIIDVLMQVM